MEKHIKLNGYFLTEPTNEAIVSWCENGFFQHKLIRIYPK